MHMTQEWAILCIANMTPNNGGWADLARTTESGQILIRALEALEAWTDLNRTLHAFGLGGNWLQDKFHLQPQPHFENKVQSLQHLQQCSRSSSEMGASGFLEPL